MLENEDKYITLKTGEINDNNTLEDLLTKSPFSFSHIKIIVLLLLFLIGDGMLMISSSLIIPIIATPFNLSKFEVSFISGSLFLGYTIGAFISGIISDNIGRKITFIIGNLIIIIGGLVPALLHIDKNIIMSCNLIIGISLGISIPCIFSLVAEVMSKDCRSIFVGMGWVVFPLGEIFLCIFSQKLHMWNYNNGNWKIILYVRLVLFFVTLFMSFFIVESPKFLLHKNPNINNDKAFSIIEELTNIELTQEQKENIIHSYINDNSEKSKGILHSFISLFSKNHFLKSLNLFVLWFISSYVFYGLIYVLPAAYQQINMVKKKTTTLNQESYNEIMSNVIISCIFEIPSNILVGILPNIKIIGRKGSINLGFGLSLIFSLVAWLSPKTLTVAASFLKGTISLGFNVLYIYTPEHYPVYMRVTSLGMCNFFSRIGGMVTPLINEILLRKSYLLNFLGFSIASFIATFLSAILPSDSLEEK